MALREYLCSYCGHQYDAIITSQDPDEYRTDKCPHCDSWAQLLPSIIGGVQGSFGTPRRANSTSMKSAKAFTGHPGNQGEPETTENEGN